MGAQPVRVHHLAELPLAGRLRSLGLVSLGLVDESIAALVATCRFGDVRRCSRAPSSVKRRTPVVSSSSRPIACTPRARNGVGSKA